MVILDITFRHDITIKIPDTTTHAQHQEIKMETERLIQVARVQAERFAKRFELKTSGIEVTE